MKEKMISKKGVMNIPNYHECFSYIDKGIPLYYFHLYKPIKLTTKLQVIDALSYGMNIYVDVDEEWYSDI
mgnify:CR=1 FL=1